MQSSTVMTGHVRFIVITTPPSEVSARIDEARRVVCEVAHSRASLSYPPHITLRTGALVPVESVPIFLDGFDAVARDWQPFSVRTDGIFSTTYRDRDIERYLVAYRVAKDAAITALNEKLLRYTIWRASNRLHFEPHLTLAFEDMDVTDFLRVREWLETNSSALPASLSWTCDNVGLYRREGDEWTAYKVWGA